MKKFFCFNCQKDVEPYKILNWRFCPVCFHRIIDDGNGFYRVCDKCGANMPPDAPKCLKCNHILDVNALQEYETISFLKKRSFLDIVFGVGFVSLSLLIFVSIVYISIYVFIAALLIGAAVLLLNMIKRG